MAWLIMRTAPFEPVAYYGVTGRWLIRRNRVPELARRFDDYDRALERVDWIKANEPPAYGEMIAVVPEAQAEAAPA